MLKNALLTCLAWAVVVTALPCLALGQVSGDPNAADRVEIARQDKEFSSARVEPARRGEQAGIAVVFEGTDDLHYYASPKTAPAPGYELKVEAKSDAFDFGKTIFPKWHVITDPVGTKVEVYAGDFTVFVPITAAKAQAQTGTADVDVKITGITCTSLLCLPPFEKALKAKIDWSQRDSWTQIGPETPGNAESTSQAVEGPDYSTWFALLIAFLAGLGLNIMPCVWPVLPLIIMRIVNQAKEGKKQSLAMGLLFCAGILLFFACLAGANIILRSFYHSTLSWGDQLRNPVVVTALALLMIVMALFMFGVFTITVPGSIANKSGARKGYVGSVGMGFLAAVLSTPCSFGILTLAFVWAQGQSLFLGTVTIIVIGLGMATPYAILTSAPGWLKRLPRSGRWMEIFKQSLGFVLLIIAVKLIKAVPAGKTIDLLYFAVVFSFCIWMWATWVPYGAKWSRRWLVRGIAVVLAISSFWFFFKPELIHWQDYDPAMIESARAEQRPVLIDFTAAWCTNCEIVDKLVYQRRDIAKLIEEKGVLAIKGDTTEAGQPATLALKNVYKEPGVPVTILFLPGRAKPIHLRGLFFGDKLKKLLESLPDKK